MGNHNKFVTAIILAAGSGRRMNSSCAKQNIEILGKSVLSWCVEAFSECKLISSIVVVAREEDVENLKRCLPVKYPKISAIVSGGRCRAESAKNGYSAIPNASEFVAIHDAARCLITAENIGEIVTCAIEYGAATAASKLTDTVKLVSPDGFIESTVPRDKLYIAGTPQSFSVEKYQRALSEFKGDLANITDDNMLLESIGEKVFTIDIGKENIKITEQKDLEYAEFLLKKRANL